ncbi:phage portal protein [soil metagenome]
MSADRFRLSESDFLAMSSAPASHGPSISNAVDSGAVIAGGGDMFEWFGGGQRAAGMNVTPETAMRSSAVWRCVTLISGVLMTLPLSVYERLPGNDRRRVDDHIFNRFLQVEASEEQSGPEFIELQSIATLLRGNGYGLMRQARNGTITDIEYYHPARVLPFRSSDKSIWYRFTNLDGTTEDFHASYVLHFKGPGLAYDGLRALSAISFHAQSIGINLATRDYTAGQFERGLMTNDYFQFAEQLSKEQREDFKTYLRRRATGVANAHNPLLLEKGGEWKRVAITAKDAQLLELLQYSVVDVARIFGCPPHMIGETSAATSWGTGIEQMTLGFVKYTIMPHMVRFAAEMSRKMFPVVGAKMPSLFVSFNEEDLLSGDSAALAEYFGRALGGNQLPGWMSQNDVRRRTKQSPIPDGDQVYWPDGAPAAPQPAKKPKKKDPANVA